MYEHKLFFVAVGLSLISLPVSVVLLEIDLVNTFQIEDLAGFIRCSRLQTKLFSDVRHHSYLVGTGCGPDPLTGVE